MTTARAGRRRKGSIPTSIEVTVAETVDVRGKGAKTKAKRVKPQTPLDRSAGGYAAPAAEREAPPTTPPILTDRRLLRFRERCRAWAAGGTLEQLLLKGGAYWIISKRRGETEDVFLSELLALYVEAEWVDRTRDIERDPALDEEPIDTTADDLLSAREEFVEREEQGDRWREMVYDLTDDRDFADALTDDEAWQMLEELSNDLNSYRDAGGALWANLILTLQHLQQGTA